MYHVLPTLEPDQHKLAIAGGMLLFVVFGIKAAILPVGFGYPKPMLLPPHLLLLFLPS
jgi:formate hydrogenlyase subunit 3/multisubunit Na+/H+ antiporter MnhD subunit